MATSPQRKELQPKKSKSYHKSNTQRTMSAQRDQQSERAYSGQVTEKTLKHKWKRHDKNEHTKDK